MKQIKCQNCGASFLISRGSSLQKCAYCGSTFLLSEEESKVGIEKPIEGDDFVIADFETGMDARSFYNKCGAELKLDVVGVAYLQFDAPPLEFSNFKDLKSYFPGATEQAIVTILRGEHKGEQKIVYKRTSDGGYRLDYFDPWIVVDSRISPFLDELRSGAEEKFGKGGLGAFHIIIFRHTDGWSVYAIIPSEGKLIEQQQKMAPDELLEQAKQIVIRERKASISLLQKKLSIGYARAGRLIDLLEQEGVVSPVQGYKGRKVLIDNSEIPPGGSEEA